MKKLTMFVGVSGSRAMELCHYDVRTANNYVYVILCEACTSSLNRKAWGLDKVMKAIHSLIM